MLVAPRHRGVAGAGEGLFRNEALNPVGGRLQAYGPLQAFVGAPYVRRVGAPDDQDGLPHRIHGPVPSHPVCDVDQGSGKGEPPSRYGDGPPKNARKTSYKDCRPRRGEDICLFQAANMQVPG